MKRGLRWKTAILIALTLAAGVALVSQAEIIVHGNIWGGFEYIGQENPEGGWIGMEAYFINSRLPQLALEFRIEENAYATIDRSFNFGLRGIFPHLSIGTGIGWLAYDAESLPELLCGDVCFAQADRYPKTYLWASAYNQFAYAKGYLELTPEGYGKTSFLADIRSKPIGFAFSYVDVISPAGIYEEARGDISLSLFYPCALCRESAYDCDFRIYTGGRAYYFYNPVDPYRGDWNGWLAGLRLISLDGEARAEVQRLYKADRWNQGWEWRLILSGSVRF